MTLHDVFRRTRTAFKELWRGAQQNSALEQSSPLELVELEDRILMSATPLAPDLLPDSHSGSTDSLNDLHHDLSHMPLLADTGDSGAPSALHPDIVNSPVLDPEANSLPSDRHELVIVDPSVQDYQQLLIDLEHSTPDAAQFDVLMLSGDSDGIDQISEALQGSSQLDAIHILSHGNDAAVKLGNVWLQSGDLAGHAGEVAQVG